MWVLLAFDFGRLSIEYLLSLAQFAVAKNFRCSLIVYLPSNQLETQNTILFVQWNDSHMWKKNVKSSAYRWSLRMVVVRLAYEGFDS